MRTVLGFCLLLAIIAAGMLSGGRYTAVAVENGNSLSGFVFVVDRFTASVQVCDRTGCAWIK